MLEIQSISQIASIAPDESYDPLTDKELADIKKTAKWGKALHDTLGLTECKDALPLIIHPEILLSMIQEISDNRSTEGGCNIAPNSGTKENTIRTSSA